MADPATLFLVGSTALGAADRLFGGDTDLRRLQEEVLAEQRETARDLRRLSLGNFTPQESARQAEQAATAVQPGLAARGISRSPAAGGALASATAQVAGAAQRQAQAQLPGVQATIQATIAALQQDTSFFDDLSAITKGFVTLQGLNQGQDKLIDDSVRLLNFPEEPDAIGGGFA